MKIPYVFKRCATCGKILLATTDNFYKQKRGLFNLSSKCKKCYIKYQAKNQKEYRKTDKFKEYKKKYRKTDKYKEYQKKYMGADKWKEYNKEYQKEYRKTDNFKKAQAKYYSTPKGKEKRAKTMAKYNSSPKGQVVAFNSQSRRRTRLANNGGQITPEQWLECMKYFDFKCCYSGEKLTKDTRSLDHIESIAQGGSNNIWNVVPMLRNLNSSKNDKDMEEWYKDQDFYSEERLAKIYEWVKYSKNKYMEVTLNA